MEHIVRSLKTVWRTERILGKNEFRLIVKKLQLNLLAGVVALFGLVVGLYAFMGLFDFLRARMLSRIGFSVDTELMRLAQKTWILQGLSSRASASKPVISALLRACSTLGRATEVRIPRMATTMSSSNRVNPRSATLPRRAGAPHRIPVQDEDIITMIRTSLLWNCRLAS